MDSQRYPRLSRIALPEDLRRFPESELPAIAEELRDYLVETVSQVGGHFGAGLGVIELTVALHYLYDTPVDRLVWDVGHQCYPHKILTGRRDTIHTVKTPGRRGAVPAPRGKRLRHLRRRPLLHLDFRRAGHGDRAAARAAIRASVVAVIGDGAMTAGMAFEALNHAGGMDPEPNLLVILNDNRMSISENVGGLTKMLGRMMSSPTMNAVREGGKKLLGDKRTTRPRASSAAGKNTGRACWCPRRCSRKWASTTAARSTGTTCPTLVEAR